MMKTAWRSTKRGVITEPRSVAVIGHTSEQLAHLHRDQLEARIRRYARRIVELEATVERMKLEAEERAQPSPPGYTGEYDEGWAGVIRRARRHYGV